MHLPLGILVNRAESFDNSPSMIRVVDGSVDRSGMGSKDGRAPGTRMAQGEKRAWNTAGRPVNGAAAVHTSLGYESSEREIVKSSLSSSAS